jgi:sugar lactone lactonase YvrE
VLGACIVPVAPDGVIDAVFEFPTPKPSSCTFGGRDLETLFVTSISRGCPGDPLAEGLFAIDAGVRSWPTIDSHVSGHHELDNLLLLVHYHPY